MKRTFDIEIDCAACALKCEEAASKVGGVKSCKINFITQKMTLEADDVDAVIKPVMKAAKKIEPDFELNE